MTGQLFTDPAGSLPEEWKHIGYMSQSVWEHSGFMSDDASPLSTLHMKPLTFMFCLTQADWEAMNQLISGVRQDQDYIIVPLGGLGGGTVVRSWRGKTLAVLSSVRNLYAVVYPDDHYHVDLIPNDAITAWLDANHCRDLIPYGACVTVTGGMATYESVGRNRRPYRVVTDPTTGELKTWTHHMRVHHHIKEYL